MKANELAAAGLFAAAWVVWLASIVGARIRLRFGERLRAAGPSTMELRDEPPAIVNLLVHDLESTGDAIAATLLDLAARGHLEIIQLSPTEHLVGRRRSAGVLRPYEARLLALVEQAAAGRPHATVGSLAQLLDGGSAVPWFTFVNEVNLDARRAGYIATPTYGIKGFLLSMVLVAASLGALNPMMIVASVVIVVPMFLVGIFAVVIGHGAVLTDKGREAGAAWLGVRRFIEDHSDFDSLPAGAVAVWDHYLAYGAAMGIADTAVHTLVAELRTTLSVSDAKSSMREIRRVHRAMSNPVANRAWRAETLPQVFGPGTGPDDIFGSDDGDFWELLTRAGTGWRTAEFVRHIDPTVWRAAVERRLDGLLATAPPELSSDLRTLVVGAQRALDVAMAPRPAEESRRNLREDPLITGPEPQGAAARVARHISAHLGCGPSVKEVVEALLLSPFEVGSLFPREPARART